MKLRKTTIAIICSLIVFLACNKGSDDEFTGVPDRDRAEVYAEDLTEIEEYLQTHFYNYDETVDDNFKIVFDTIEGANQNKVPLIDQVDFKMVSDPTDDTISYKLYFLDVRPGGGDSMHSSDKAFVTYEGTKLDGDIFDSAITPISFNLITVGAQTGVVPGFREGLLEFDTATGFTDNPDGTVSYQDFGIGAVFIPSGLGYFSLALAEVPSYSPLIFKFDLVKRSRTDYEFDNIPSFIEDLDSDGDCFNDDTDGDLLPNFIDNDDDGDGVLTRDEDLEPDEDLTVDADGDGDPTNDIGDGDPTNDDTDGDGIPNYLDEDSTESNQVDS